MIAVIELAKDEPIKHTSSSESTGSHPSIFSRSDVTKHDRYNASDLIKEVPKSSLPGDKLDATEKIAITPATPSRSLDDDDDDNKVNTTRNTLPLTSYPRFTLKRVSTCISSSENVRLVCATLIAFLVILPYYGYNLPGKDVTSASVLTFKPLYLILLTDATIVLLLLLLNDKPERNNNHTQQSVSGEFNLAKALELCMVVRKAIKSVLVDCSICALVMMIGFPLGSVGVL